jgi:hypothetical protein
LANRERWWIECDGRVICISASLTDQEEELRCDAGKNHPDPQALTRR